MKVYKHQFDQHVWEYYWHRMKKLWRHYWETQGDIILPPGQHHY